MARNTRTRRLSLLILVLALATPRVAAAGIDNVGTTGANFLSLGSGAAVMGMGGAAVGTFGDLSSVQWNAASLGALSETQMVFSHAPLSGGGAQDWVGIGGRMGYSATRWAMNGIYQGDGSFDGRDAFGNSTGSFNASSMALGATVSHTFGEVATIGVGAKLVSEKLADVSGLGGTFDAGLQLQRGMFGFGLAAQNFGGRITYGGVPYSMPTNIGAGVSYSVPASGLRFALDYNRPSAYYGDVRAGVEWMWKGRVALRTGYRHEMNAPSSDALSGPTFGMGAGVRGVWFDYGYLSASNGDGEQRIALRVSPRMLNGGLDMNDEHANAKAGESSSHAASFVPTETPAATTVKPATAAVPTSSAAAPVTTSAARTTSAIAPASATATGTAAATATGTATAAAATKAATSEAKSAALAAGDSHAQLTSMADAQAQPQALAPRATAPPKAAIKPVIPAREPTWAPVPAPETPAPAAVAPTSAAVTTKPATTNETMAKAAALLAPAAKPAVSDVPKPVAAAKSMLDQVTVKSGDTMESIAKRFNTSVAAIMMENNLVSEHVKTGQKLKIPNQK
jgi:LysM repeat protein